MSTILEFFDITQHGTGKCDVPLTEPLFESFPPELIIDDYDAFGTYEFSIKFRNRDSVPRRIRVLHPEPMHFFIKQSSRSMSQTQKSRKTSSRVASGMSVEYIITFSPEERREYSCDLMVETEREKFYIPIRAKGHPIQIEYPDTINYGDIPVNFDNHKVILLRNVGHKATKWQIHCEGSSPIHEINESNACTERNDSNQDSAGSMLSFSPFEGCLEPDGFINVAVNFHPNV